MSTEAWHGTLNGYSNYRCRCGDCRAANTTYRRERRASTQVPRAMGLDHERISDLLNELFPLGLTDDCPARRPRARA